MIFFRVYNYNVITYIGVYDINTDTRGGNLKK